MQYCYRHNEYCKIDLQQQITTWAVSSPDLLALANHLRGRTGVQQAVVFGNTLHVSGDNASALEQAVTEFQKAPYNWQLIDSDLEDVFIHLMERSQEKLST